MIPEAVWRRPKMGFTLPFQRWMLSALRAEIDATFSTAAALENIGVKTHAAQSVWREFIAAPAAVPWSRPWTLHVLARWCTTHGMTR
jgi:asparagine synthase (glutamine-hydrolysing)